MIHLRGAALRPSSTQTRGFPFDLPAIGAMLDLPFDDPVTVFVGENGSGKSTLLEALAIAARSISVGSDELADDPTLAGPRALAADLRLTWANRPGRGFYLRAEDFFGYAKRMDATRAGLETELRRVEVEYVDAPDLARSLARMPLERELAALTDRYGDGLDTHSHGESFLHFFQQRLVPGGIYFLDEPEAPLSPSRQLSFLALLKHMVGRDIQVIMATHSPILLAFPGAAIWSFDAVPMRRVAYADLEHVNLTRDFLRDPDAFLRHL